MKCVEYFMQMFLKRNTRLQELTRPQSPFVAVRCADAHGKGAQGLTGKTKEGSTLNNKRVTGDESVAGAYRYKRKFLLQLNLNRKTPFCIT